MKRRDVDRTWRTGENVTLLRRRPRVASSSLGDVDTIEETRLYRGVVVTRPRMPDRAALLAVAAELSARAVAVVPHPITEKRQTPDGETRRVPVENRDHYYLDDGERRRVTVDYARGRVSEEILVSVPQRRGGSRFSYRTVKTVATVAPHTGDVTVIRGRRVTFETETETERTVARVVKRATLERDVHFVAASLPAREQVPHSRFTQVGEEAHCEPWFNSVLHVASYGRRGAARVAVVEGNTFSYHRRPETGVLCPLGRFSVASYCSSFHGETREEARLTLREEISYDENVTTRDRTVIGRGVVVPQARRLTK